MGNRRALFTKADLLRVLDVVRDAGLEGSLRVVITRNGDILIEPITEDAMITIEQLATEPKHDANPTLQLVPEDQISL